MTATLIDGNQVAETIRAEVRRQTTALAAEGRRLKLAALLVGEPAASLVYARSQEKQCQAMGIDYLLSRLPADCDASCVADRIQDFNQDPGITGIMLHLPLPTWIDVHDMQYRIDPYKDVEGVNPANIGLVFYGQPIIAPCTALAVVELVQTLNMPLRGIHAVVVGQGAIVGRPISVLLAQKDATVTACNEHTPDLAEYTRRADLLVVAAGKAGLITVDHVKPGAMVIDVGINRVKGSDINGNEVSRTVGDVDFRAVREVAGAITPVPGGVGPVTVAMLMRNTVEAARKQAIRKP
ncbi:MAG: bifunctional 5,10-methylenetetrahydrofolate dehydrogenase/5,10-methenyltetrahydrofolate cyclohydrolase [Phycisphaerae bacterium]|nr:bifunctional 5,10-methylenetetrahydrofolate dehydrogenase/5,10-methenyltetrahydrofolate cyclohydrolase [Phycisphaerae bacterium]